MATAAAAGTFDIADMTVNRLGFGAMRITGKGVWGDPPNRDAARAVLRRAVELEVNLIDTADSYGPEVSEELIAEALYPYPDDLVIATKGGLERSGPGQWHRNGHPDHLREACENSLRRLRLERIDLYQLHAPDPGVPIADSLGELNALQNEGKIRHIGVSNFDTEQLAQARELSTDRLGPEPLQRQRPHVRARPRGLRARCGSDSFPGSRSAPATLARSACRSRSPGCCTNRR